MRSIVWPPFLLGLLLAPLGLLLGGLVWSFLAIVPTSGQTPQAERAATWGKWVCLGGLVSSVLLILLTSLTWYPPVTPAALPHP